MRLVLASQSPRRRQLFESIGLTFDVVPADVDETDHAGEDPVAYVGRIARMKADEVALRLGNPDGVCVLAADTTVDLDRSILAKPVDDAEARSMLRRLSGRTHRVHTAVVGWTQRGTETAVVTTDVTFVALTEDDLDRYLAIGEHRDKAGAYGMQSAGGVFVRRIDGSPSNVIGLPLAETIDVLRACASTLQSG